MIKTGMIIGDRYEILEKIGTGGMSDVYKARCHKLNRFVAVKVLKQEFSENSNFVSKFRIEAQAAAGLMHPNIVNVYDVGEENGIYYFVMELVEGITLKRYIEKKARLGFKEAISIAIQVSMGIEAAHNHHIIHRDIKPQNIIISREGKVKVTDFGIAKAATSNTITSNVMGSVHYTSPEQARGGYSDEKSDIYSLGITMFEMLTGRVPFDGETTVAIAIKHIQEQMPSPKEFVPEIPDSVEAIVLRCCSKSPDRRYQNMSEVIADLKQCLMNPSTVTVHDGPDMDGNTRRISKEEMDQIKRSTNRGKKTPVAEETVRQRQTTARKNDGRGERKPKNQTKSKLKERLYEDFDDDLGGDYDFDPGMEKITTILAVVAGLVICGIIIFLLLQVFDVLGKDSDQKDETGSSLIIESQENQQESEEESEDLPAVKQVEVPRVVGWNEVDAKTVMNNRKLVIEIEYEENDEYKEGIVISTDIPAGTMVAEGTVINLLVSSGPAGVTVENVVGKVQADAKSTLESAGLIVAWEESFSDVAPGIVIQQNPAGDTVVEPGSTVRVVVSKGNQGDTVRIPNLIGKSEKDALDTLSSLGLSIKSVSQVSSTTVPAGQVCYQNYSEGSYVLPGTAMEIHISTGP